MSVAARKQYEAETRETHELIGSDKVQGTRVYDVDGNDIGKIERVMLEKRGGRVSYAVLSFGGFFGIGDDHYPLPWETLSYDEELGGYRISLTKDQIEGAPTEIGNDADFTPEFGSRVYQYYGIPPYWI